MKDMKTTRSAFPRLLTHSLMRAQKSMVYRSFKQALARLSPGTLARGQVISPLKGSLTTMRGSSLLALAALAAQLSLQTPAAIAQTEAPGSVGASAAAVALASEDAAVGVDINTASAAELATQLNGVGESKAEAIVRYREQFGPFESIEELSEVTGIGISTIEKNRAMIRLR